MGLRFICGRSGVGKTKYLRERVINEAIKNPDVNYCVMVPEQSNLQTQKEYVKAHPDEGILNIDILSFKRLAYRVFSEVGGFNNQVLNESGKLMVLKKLVNDNSDSLSLLQKPLRRIDSITKLKSILSEFAQYHVNGASLEGILKEDRLPGLSSKLQDILLIQDAFYEYITESYITDEQIMDVLAERIEVSDFVKKTVFVLDEFTGFTYLQNEVLRKLLKYSADVRVSLTMDISYINKTVVPVHDLFALSVNTKTELIRIASEENVSIHPSVLIESESKNCLSEFEFLEQHLFEYDDAVFEEKTDNIVICKSPSPENEVLYLRNTIAGLVRQDAYSYKDIAVVCGDLNRYGLYFEKYLSDAHIPCFVDDSKAMVNNSMLEAVRSLIKMCIEDFSYKSVFSFLRNNLNNLKTEDVDILENYVIAKGIRSFKLWSTEWERPVDKQDPEQLQYINSIRESFISDIKEFVFVMNDEKSLIRDKACSLYAFFADNNMEGKLLGMSEYFESIGDYVRSVEYRQVYGLVINLLDELVDIMGEKSASAGEFMDILDAGISSLNIGVLPPGNDYVLLGDVERTRFAKTKVLFLLGANEGIIPKNNERIGFLNETERLALKEAGVSLAPSSHEEYYTQRYYLYRMFTKATEKLFVCFSEGGNDNGEYLPSYIVKNLKSRFPYCREIEFSDLQKPETNSDVYKYIINGDGKYQPLKDRFYSYLVENEEYKKRLDMYQHGLIYKGEEDCISEKLSESLFLNKEKRFETSVSRLENYSECPFAHFMKYGLEVSDRVRPEMSYIDYGNIFHFALENYVLMIKQMNMDVTQIRDDVADTLAEECINKAYETVYRSYHEPSARDKYHIKRMVRLMRRTVWAMKRQFSDSDFSIDSVEFKFNSAYCDYHLALENNRNIYLKGKIDRIDTFSDGEKDYVRIVDYKSGATDFSLLKFYHGLQLQLVMYLDIATEIYSKKHNTAVIPAGAFYYTINDPVIADKNGDDELIESEILNKLKLHGCESDEEETLDLILKHGRKKVIELSEGIMGGNIQKNPYFLHEGGGKSACDYCDYKTVCGFDKSLPWCRERILDSVRSDEIINRLKESEGAADEVDR